MLVADGLSLPLGQIVQTTTGITDKAQVRTLAKNTTDKLCLKEFDKVTGQPYFILKPQYTKDDAT